MGRSRNHSKRKVESVKDAHCHIFLFNFIIDEILHAALDGLHEIGVELVPADRLCDLGCADDVVCLFESNESAQIALSRLGEVVLPYGMHVAPSRCQILLQDWSPAAPTLKLNEEPLDVVEGFTYLIAPSQMTLVSKKR